MVSDGLDPYEVLLNGLGLRDINEASPGELLGYHANIIREDVFMHRIDQAERHLRAAQSLYASEMFMASITRSYYAAYNALRAFNFQRNGHDKWGSHSVLASNVHRDLPGCSRWSNELQLMRQTRNQCDYEVCTAPESTYSGKAFHYVEVASNIIKECLERV